MTLEAYIQALTDAEEELTLKNFQFEKALPDLVISTSDARELMECLTTSANETLNLGDGAEKSCKAAREKRGATEVARSDKPTKERSVSQKAAKPNPVKEKPTKENPSRREKPVKEKPVKAVKGKPQKKKRDSAIIERLAKLNTTSVEQQAANLPAEQSIEDIIANGLVEQFFHKFQERKPESPAVRAAKLAARQNTLDLSFRRVTYVPYPGNDHEQLRQRLIATREWRANMLQNKQCRTRSALRVIEAHEPIRVPQYKLTKSMMRWFGVVRNDSIISAHLRTYLAQNKRELEEPESSSRYKHLRKVYGNCVT